MTLAMIVVSVSAVQKAGHSAVGSALIRIITFIFLLGISPVSLAGWLSGPENYDDCVLEKMKGQSKNVIGFAKSACEIEFPFEKLLSGIGHQIDISWMKKKDGILIYLKKNSSDYLVTKVRVLFSIDECSSSKTKFTHNNLFEFEDGMWHSRFYIETPPDFKCMRTDEIYGMRRKPNEENKQRKIDFTDPFSPIFAE